MRKRLLVWFVNTCTCTMFIFLVVLAPRLNMPIAGP